jgi:hypothetical protein
MSTVNIAHVIARIPDTKEGFWLKHTAICALHIVAEAHGKLEFTKPELFEAINRYCAGNPQRLQCVSTLVAAVHAFQPASGTVPA